jgi:hypothetical protein
VQASSGQRFAGPFVLSEQRSAKTAEERAIVGLVACVEAPSGSKKNTDKNIGVRT